MKQLDDYSLFETCLSRLEAGEDLEAILASYPERADKLRPLLLAAIKARQSGKPIRVPASAQVDSRTRFLIEASQIQERKQHGLFFQLRYAGVTALIVLFIAAGIYGTAVASTQTVPGETLYPVKRAVEQAQLALTDDQVARLQLEEEFDRRRVAETAALAKTGRPEKVALAGQLIEKPEQGYSVGGLKLALDPEEEALARSLSGSYVEVEGVVRGEEGVEVEKLELRLFNISGTLQAISSTEWTVSGVKVLIMDNTQITGTPAVGKKVEMTALHNLDEYFLALSVRVTGKGSNGQEVPPPSQDGSDEATPEARGTTLIPLGSESTPAVTLKPFEQKENHAPEQPLPRATEDQDAGDETPEEMENPTRTPEPDDKND